MSRVLPYVVFLLCYAVLSVLLAIPADFVVNLILRHALEMAAFVAAAPVAIFLAQRLGQVSASGLLITSLLLTALLYALVWGIYHWQSLQVGSSVPFWRVAQVGGWPFALGLLVQVLAPVIWRFLLPRPNSSFKPTPLRSSS